MSFFPPDPEVPEPAESEWVQPAWWAPPEDELPALLPVSEILATTDHVTIALVGAFVYRDGVELRLERRLRREGLPAREWSELCETFMENGQRWGPGDPGTRLRFGVVLGDGERVFDSAPYGAGGDPEVRPAGHTLTRRGGGGGGGHSSYTGTDGLWLWPAPGPGEIELVMQWPALGITERRTTLDATQMLALLSDVKPFWP